MPGLKHLHQYKKVYLGGTKSKPKGMVYRCMLPDCPHFLQPSMVPGRYAECRACGRKFIVTKELLYDKVFITCGCTKGKREEPEEMEEKKPVNLLDIRETDSTAALLEKLGIKFKEEEPVAEDE